MFLIKIVYKNSIGHWEANSSCWFLSEYGNYPGEIILRFLLRNVSILCRILHAFLDSLNHLVVIIFNFKSTQ